MEGNPHGDINKEQKIRKQYIDFCKKPKGAFAGAPLGFFCVYEHYY